MIDTTACAQRRDLAYRTFAPHYAELAQLSVRFAAAPESVIVMNTAELQAISVGFSAFVADLLVSLAAEINKGDSHG